MRRCTRKLFRISLLSTILLLALISPSAVWAIPVTWSFDAPIQLGNGGTIDGSFVFDAGPPQNYSQISLTVSNTGNATFDGLYTHHIGIVSPGFATFAKTAPPANLTNFAPMILFDWEGSLPALGGTIEPGRVLARNGLLFQTAYIGTCTSETCNGRSLDRVNGATSTWSATGTPVPEPSTMILFGSGLAGLIGWRLRKQKSA